MAKYHTKPGRWLYWIGALVIVVGIVASIASALSSLTGMKTVTVPGQTTLDLTKTGEYQITYAYSTSSGSNTAITDYSPYSDLKFTLTGENGGANVAVTSINDKQLKFTLTQAGKYKLNAAYSGKVGPSATVVLLPIGSIPGVLISIIFYGGLIVGIAIIVLTIILRRKNRVWND
jgi:hypothetical protein